MKLIKLTDKDNQTRNQTQWGVNVTHELPETSNPELCSGSVLHAYKSINQALLMWPVHEIDSDFNIWEAEGEVVVEDATKVGVFKLTTNQIVQPPDWYKDKITRKRVQVKFAILCSVTASSILAKKFPNGIRPRKAIEAAENSAAAADAAAAHAAYANRATADAAARAARAAARAAELDLVKLADEAIDYVENEINNQA